ncbi:MAG: CRISPR-associated protein Cas4 [Thermoplasmata archaeon]
MNAAALLVVALGLAGVGLAVCAGVGFARLHRDRRLGTLVAIDAGRGGSVTLRSERYRLVGRPDLVRRRADGRAVPVELKSRAHPRGGPARSHILQLWVYCLLLEESEGRSPPFGVLRYGDGVEFEVPWGDTERRILVEIRREMDQPYDGRARPSPGRCARCRWVTICDARV